MIGSGSNKMNRHAVNGDGVFSRDLLIRLRACNRPLSGARIKLGFVGTGADALHIGYIELRGYVPLIGWRGSNRERVW